MLKKLVCIAIVAAAVSAQAQDFFHRPSPLAGRTLLTLSLFEEVQTELKMTPDETKKADDLVGKLGSEIQDAVQGGGSDPSALRPAIEKVNQKYDDLIVAALTADQNKRLKELFVQFNGGSAIASLSVQKELAITDDQKTKIKAAQDDNFTKMMQLFSSGAPDPDAMKKLQDELGSTLTKILTDDQQTKFKAMQGAKFEFKKA